MVTSTCDRDGHTLILICAMLAPASLFHWSSGLELGDGGSMRIEVLGIHEVQAPEPCHLVEILVVGDTPEGVIASITQECPGQARDNWQVPYEERFLTSE